MYSSSLSSSSSFSSSSSSYSSSELLFALPSTYLSLSALVSVWIHASYICVLISLSVSFAFPLNPPCLVSSDRLLPQSDVYIHLSRVLDLRPLAPDVAPWYALVCRGCYVTSDGVKYLSVFLYVLLGLYSSSTNTYIIYHPLIPRSGNICLQPFGHAAAHAVTSGRLISPQQTRLRQKRQSIHA